MSSGRGALVMLAVGVAGLGATHAGASRGSAPLAAGDLVTDSVVVRAAPNERARRVTVLHEFRKDFRPQIVLAVREARGPGGGRWVELSLPGRPNGGRGWVPKAAVELHRVLRRIVVHRGARELEVKRILDGKVLLRAPIAIGKPGSETPLGRNYYVQARFVPKDPFFGRFALETSAYSRLSEWPGGGVVGIHGSDSPQLIGQAVSHGCIRMLNRDVVRLNRLAPLGTPIDVLP